MEEWTVRSENLDGSIQLDHPSMQPRDREDVVMEKLAPLRVMQIRMPVNATAKIIEQTKDINNPGSIDYQKLSTNSRFYLLTGSDGKLKLVDQVRFSRTSSKSNRMQTPRP